MDLNGFQLHWKLNIFGYWLAQEDFDDVTFQHLIDGTENTAGQFHL